MALVAVLTVPEQGHMNALYGLVAELSRRGEQVTCYSTEAFRQPIENAGAKLVCYPDPDSLTPPATAAGSTALCASTSSVPKSCCPS